MLTKQTILSKVSSYEIIDRCLQPYHDKGRLLQGRNISNPFLSQRQSTPSFNTFCASPQNEWRYKDFATGDEGSCFDLVMRLLGVTFPQALQRISSDFGLNEKDASVNSKATGRGNDTDNEKPFEVLTRNFTKKESEFWAKFGITEETLRKYNVNALEKFSTSNKEGKPYTVRSSPENPIFSYNYCEGAKLYKPFAQKKYRFQFLGEKDPGCLFGYDQLPPTGDIVIVTGGEKDVLSLAAKSFPAITLNSETANLNPEVVREMKERFKELVVLYDNDETGLRQSEALSREHNLKRIVLPNIPNGKDISDFFASGKTSEDLPKTRLIRTLEYLKEFRGLPEMIRVDNGPEFISSKLDLWCKEQKITLVFIQPGKPMQNAYVERCNGNIRRELLNAYVFKTLNEVREKAEEWRLDYNCSRPHSSLVMFPQHRHKIQIPIKTKKLLDFILLIGPKNRRAYTIFGICQLFLDASVQMQMGNAWSNLTFIRSLTRNGMLQHFI
jgi:hypothetical protein